MGSSQVTPPSSSSQDTTKGNSDVSEGDFAFLIHSHESLSQQTAPEVDNQRLVRQKRRRTSPEDHAILEAEYERNPKPDKAARMDIVGRVALGEKEVQIWFQNRRQMTRRKSRPLLPHEVISNFYTNRYPNIAPSSSLSTNDNSLQQDQPSQGSVLSGQTTVDCYPPTQTVLKAADPIVHDGQTPWSNSAPIEGHSAACDAKDESSGLRKPTEIPASSDVSMKKLHDKPSNDTRSLSQTFPDERHLGYFANRRSAPFMVHDEHGSAAHSSGPSKLVQGNTNQSSPRPPHSLKRASSLVRLSLSLDGKAEVTTRTGNTPSPPCSKPASVNSAAGRSHVGLQRSHSALEPGDKSGQNPFSVPFSRRSMAGRSRDARTWEFYCDSDARNALTEQAEREERGSATAAISLIRSHSQTNKVMTPNSHKRNAHTQKAGSTKRFKVEGPKSSRPKLARAISSVARLQTTKSNNQQSTTVNKSHKKSKSGSQTVIFEDIGDSDKENWEPGTQTSNPRRRKPAKFNQAVSILQESQLVPSQSSSLDALMHRESIQIGRSSMESSSSEEKENLGPGVDDEVAVFMGKTVPREVEDLDCVQQLLSLSQAAWQ